MQRCVHVAKQRCTLHCGNVAGTSFSQRCENNLLTTLYKVVFTLCVCWGGAAQAVSGCRGGRRGHIGRQGFRGQEEGQHMPSVGLGAGGGAAQAVRGSGGGRRGYTGCRRGRG